MQRPVRTGGGIELILRLAGQLSSTLLTLGGVRLASLLHPYNLIMTNVPGPQVPLYLLGTRMLKRYPQLPPLRESGSGCGSDGLRR